MGIDEQLLELKSRLHRQYNVVSYLEKQIRKLENEKHLADIPYKESDFVLMDILIDGEIKRTRQKIKRIWFESHFQVVLVQPEADVPLGKTIPTYQVSAIVGFAS